MTNIAEELRCPDSRSTWYCDVAICNLNDKICVVESGCTCPYYDEWKQEQEEANNEKGLTTHAHDVL